MTDNVLLSRDDRQAMMPQCIGMTLPAIDPERRRAVAAAIISEIVDKGSAGMSDARMRSFLEALDEVSNRSKRTGYDSKGELEP